MSGPGANPVDARVHPALPDTRPAATSADVDEMRYLPDWLAEDSELRRAIDFCEQHGLHDTYCAYDRAALKHQQRLSSRVLEAASFGFLAVVLALLELAKWPPFASVSPRGRQVAAFVLVMALLWLAASSARRGHFGIALAPGLLALITLTAPFLALFFQTEQHSSESLEVSILETVTILAALSAVIFGLWSASHHEWLLDRCRAERLRCLRFRFLMDARLWCGVPDKAREAREWFVDELLRIKQMNKPTLERWLGEDVLPIPPAIPAGPGPSPQTREELRRYYREARFEGQYGYFSRKSEPRATLYRLTKNLPQGLFFLTALVVGVHFGSEVVTYWAGPSSAGPMPPLRTDGASSAHAWGPLLLVLAVVLPALGAAARTFLLAHEFGRNALRSTAKASALEGMAERLRVNSSTSNAELFQDVWAAEHVIESDQREWLRLMIEAEWFG